MFGSLRSLIDFSGSKLRAAEQREGERLFEESDYAGAELHLAQAILESERRQESADQRILLRLELAESQRRQVLAGGDPRKLADAEASVRQAHDLASRTMEHELLVQCTDALAVIANGRGDLEESARLELEASALEAKLKRRDPLQTAQRLHRLGTLRQQQGRTQEAAEFLGESAAIHERVLGENHLATAHRFSDLGAAHYALGNHEEAQRCLRRAIRVHEKECGLESPEAVSDLQILTASLEATGDIDGAVAQLERVLALKLRVVGLDLDAVAAAQWELAQRYLGWRRYSRARELLMEAVGMFKRTGGPRLAGGYEALARLEEETGHYNEALRELARAAKVWESLKSDCAADLIRNMEHRAFLFEQLRQNREAAYLREQVSALTKGTRWAEAG